MANDLNKSIALFNQQMDALALQRTFNTANEQVQQIRASEESEASQRQQLRQLSENIALQLGGQGAPVAQIQQAQQVISPQDPREMLLFKHQLDLDKERVKNATKPGRPLPMGATKRLAQFGEHRALLSDLVSSVEADKDLVGLINRAPGAVYIKKLHDPKFAAFHDRIETFFQEYRKRITGAQASVKELAILREIIPQAGDTSEVFLGRVHGALKQLDLLQNSYLDSMEKSNFDTGRWRVGQPGAVTGTTKQSKKISPGFKF